MLKKTLLFLALSSVAFVSATPVAQAVEPPPTCPPVAGILAGLAQIQICGYTSPDGSKFRCTCSDPKYKCCYLTPSAEAGVCLFATACLDFPPLSLPSPSK
ncbi:hypothetical protein Agabi119p4_8086 [Agaricus bisporus var. burnettii]|uniref:Uncharacterized protein n=1 Tax=Agaricus bisporus var. burnettii TaxID=192524 RepID=A0A8H7C6I1_AGABI|nr:hypothetical protein Agabi119p4_8086 [Agaricus bisporus var. burnettii]